MTDEEAQEIADKVQEISLSTFKVALTVANVLVALEAIEEGLHRSSVLLSEVVKELPPEVQERLHLVYPGQDDEGEKEEDSLRTWIRRILKGGK